MGGRLMMIDVTGYMDVNPLEIVSLVVSMYAKLISLTISP